MKRSLKNKIVAMPLIGYLARVMGGIVKGPQIRDQLNTNLVEILNSQASQQDRIEQIAQELKELKEQGKKVTRDHEQYARDIDDTVSAIQRSQDNLRQAFNLLQASNGPPRKKVSNGHNSDLFADNHNLDVFYTLFEDRFRGTEELITNRLREYLPLFINSRINFDKNPVLDIGCGRGEFLQLLKSTLITAVGLDINYDMVRRAQEKGLKVTQGDAVAHLEKSGPQKYGAITGFHIVEHIPFNVLMKMFTAAHKSLVRGGFVLFETPNPENVTVGSAGFYMDPSHLNPLPPDLLAFALEVCGYRKIDIMRLHPAVRPENTNLHPQIANYFYGPLDYAVIAYK
ncbi:MAG: methyltransferase domain-containing protein [Candidatus Chaera renei]|uniref:Methyltransferase domain-containing protein n=1 Tax=Candidatus Chaera renei TaxID=2506947 RepID=A0A4Q0AIZ2_9BACT|nr:MAG: methyltransferase domain-containing protein [Candidatus Chaera renei]